MGVIVEPHGDAHAVLEQNAKSQIQHEEHADGQKRRHISLFHVEPQLSSSRIPALRRPHPAWRVRGDPIRPRLALCTSGSLFS